MYEEVRFLNYKKMFLIVYPLSCVSELCPLLERIGVRTYYTVYVFTYIQCNDIHCVIYTCLPTLNSLKEKEYKKYKALYDIPLGHCQ